MFYLRVASSRLEVFQIETLERLRTKGTLELPKLCQLYLTG